MDYYYGYIALFPYHRTPSGWLLCNGQTIAISSNEVLFSLLGTSYGGDGRSNFAIPNMLGLEPIPGMNYYICIKGEYPPKQQ